jgi:hypothetical protein
MQGTQDTARDRGPGEEGQRRGVSAQPPAEAHKRRRHGAGCKPRRFLAQRTRLPRLPRQLWRRNRAHFSSRRQRRSTRSVVDPQAPLLLHPLAHPSRGHSSIRSRCSRSGRATRELSLALRVGTSAILAAGAFGEFISRRHSADERRRVLSLRDNLHLS